MKTTERQDDLKEILVLLGMDPPRLSLSTPGIKNSRLFHSLLPKSHQKAEDDCFSVIIIHL